MDTTVKAVLEQNFAKWQERSEQDHRLMTGANSNVAEQTRLMYLRGVEQMSMREAAAQQRLDADKLASQILQQRSARDQPQTGGTT